LAFLPVRQIRVFWPVKVAQWLSNLKIGGSNPATGSGTVREKMAVKPFSFFQTNSLPTTAAPGSQEDSAVHEEKPS
jgi:hypothetical protein